MMEKRWVRYEGDEMKEEKALERHQTPNKDLRDAMIMVPEGTELSAAALNTIQGFCYSGIRSP